jgi:hypothetical protein
MGRVAASNRFSATFGKDEVTCLPPRGVTSRPFVRSLDVRSRAPPAARTRNWFAADAATGADAAASLKTNAPSFSSVDALWAGAGPGARGGALGVRGGRFQAAISPQRRCASVARHEPPLATA